MAACQRRVVAHREEHASGGRHCGRQLARRWPVGSSKVQPWRPQWRPPYEKGEGGWRGGAKVCTFAAAIAGAIAVDISAAIPAAISAPNWGGRCRLAAPKRRKDGLPSLRPPYGSMDRHMGGCARTGGPHAWRPQWGEARTPPLIAAAHMAAAVAESMHPRTHRQRAGFGILTGSHEQLSHTIRLSIRW